ncbi:glycosyltransferase family 2 protein [Lactococcus lactis]|uniref:Glycosyltransferase n=2 Tax=Lactococcus lactis TaxID=1358 RepID=A0A6M0MAD6_9LACT|nr:glycosyltransferase family 2 protein [Lactococcus lactis]MCT1173367.1 glycosyltransferase family 2 protein [Lactococcus lactis]MCT1185328.1 glycosyltransferase family 2 protein [Lactococcus lactis]MCT1189899.1 glycosyltransferase family 2 protein [Lactococcus lactis]NEX50246.1 glycosyltransferase [Lactococcus lactis]NEX56307.1 glycosyltransferase [Lactococcus lactis]
MDSKELQEEFTYYNYLDNEKWKLNLPSYEKISSEVVSDLPKVSVIIANYNNAPYLEKMLDSLVNQTIGLEKLQLLFIDDKSTDTSVEIVHQYLKKYESIEIYQLTKNTGGAHGPRNVGILNARGEFLVFLDADDWYDENALQYMSGTLEKSGDDMGFFGVVQSVNGKLSLKSKAYYFDGNKIGRAIQELPSAFYEWLGPQGIMVKRSLIEDNNLHFPCQKVADDVTFFYEAMRFSKNITQGKKLTTYLNRDDNNVGLSKTINRDFMVSWLRALAYINQTFPDDISKEKFLARRLEWLVYNFGLRRDVGYKFSLKRIRDFKISIDKYLGELKFDPTIYFRTGARKTVWKYLLIEDYRGVIRFNRWHSLRHIIKKYLGIMRREENQYFYPVLNSNIPKISINMRAIAVNLVDGQVVIQIYTNGILNYFEIRNKLHPFDRNKISSKKSSLIEYKVDIPLDLDLEMYDFWVIYNGYQEQKIERIEKFISKNSL